MSTISTKFLPHRQQPHVTKSVHGERQSELPSKTESMNLKSSICFSEPRPENASSVLFASTKSLDYDELGNELLASGEHVLEKQRQEKESVDGLIRDMRSKHYDFGHDTDPVKTLHQDSFARPSNQYLHEVRDNIVKRGSDMGHTKVLNLPPKFGYFVADEDVQDWNQSHKDTNYTTEYTGPYNQLVNNADQGRDLLLDSHHKTRKELQEKTSAVPLHSEKDMIEKIFTDSRKETKEIKTMMRNSHFFFGDDPRQFSTVHKTSYDEKEPDKNEQKLDHSYIAKSSIVFGHQNEHQRRKEMSSTYGHELCKPAIEQMSQDDIHNGNLKDARQQLHKTMISTSVVFGSDPSKHHYVSQMKGEFRDIVYK
jgi:hypothetical protein